MSEQIIKPADPKTLPIAIGERALSGEHEKQPKRLVVLGARSSGAEQLVEDLHKQIEVDGIEGVSVVYTPHTERLEDAFFGRPNDRFFAQPGDPIDDTPETIPDGVIAYPTMRYHGDLAMTVETPIDRITALCAEHDVPLVVVSQDVLEAGDIARALPELGLAAK
jgi:hypothetical protein